MDLVVEQLRSRRRGYLRLDLDLLARDWISLDPLGPTLRQVLGGEVVREVSNPEAIFYRAPTHLRESSGHRYTPEELLARHQWAAFARSLAVFRTARWVNHPVATYAAENKPYQLAIARTAGLLVPETYVSNYPPEQLLSASAVALKALDSFLLRKGNSDLFFYTTSMAPAAIGRNDCQAMPLTFQTLIAPKIDVRVTVVGDRYFAAETDRPVVGDWRLQKEGVQFRDATIPPAVAKSCVEIVRELGLVYGAIDLARTRDDYYFLEINPTGEWAWLDDAFDGRITQAIVEALIGS